MKTYLRKKFGPRRVQVFCLGAAKTGTTSLAHMFARCYRAAHEPQPSELTGRVIDHLKGIASSDDTREWLLRRDQQLRLELEASHPLGYLAPHLVELFPSARFIVTVRQPKPWLKSRLNFHLHRDPPEWRAYRDYIWGKGHSGYPPEESVLEQRGLYALAAYLNQYVEQYQLLLETLPSDRVLFVATESLDEKTAQLADFLSIPEHSIDRAHANRLAPEESVMALLDNDYVDAVIEQCCAAVFSNLKARVC